MKIRNLIVAFAAILMVPAFAIAEPPPGKGSGKGPQPQVLVVRDANGALVGEVFGQSKREQIPGDGILFYTVNIAFRGDPSQAIYFETNPLVIIQVSPTTGLMSYPTVSYKTTDCSGTAYIEDRVGARRLILNLRMLPVVETLTGQILYVPADPAEPTVGFARSAISEFDGTCNETEGGQFGIEATEVFLDFEPPYAIGY